MRLGKHDVVVIGAGVVGLGIAQAVARSGRSVLVIEREVAVGRGASSRTSGVVHAGLHHPEDWLKSVLARRGRQMLYAFCARHGVPVAKSGKWIVAVDEAERAALEALAGKAARLHLDTRWLEAAEALREEPKVRVHAALQIEQTGVVRTSELLRALQSEVESLGGEILIGVEVDRLVPGPIVRVGLTGGPVLEAQEVVVAAGLETDALLRRSGLDVQNHGLRQHLCKGEWVALSERHRKQVSRHIYPLPHEDGSGLGIHLTRDVDGYLAAGPDVEWLEPRERDGEPLFSLTREKIPAFGAALRRFYPDVSDADLDPMMVGIRPKLSWKGEPARDFEIWRGAHHGWQGITALAGIESPGLTACLALGDHVAAGL